MKSAELQYRFSIVGDVTEVVPEWHPCAIGSSRSSLQAAGYKQLSDLIIRVQVRMGEAKMQSRIMMVV